jgi:hypothetical protein
MSHDRLLNELFIKKELFKDATLLLKKKESLNKLLLLSLNETNDHLNKIFLNIIQTQHRLFNYLLEEKDRYAQRQTLENLLHQILQNDNLLIDKLKRIYLKLKKKQRKRKKSFNSSRKTEQTKILVSPVSNENDQPQSNLSNDQILKIYWRSISSNNLHKENSFAIRKSSSDTHLDHISNKFSLINHFPANIRWDFPKLEKLNRTRPRLAFN